MAASSPAITIHYAQTLDGKIGTSTGHSQWISGEASLCFAHELRATHDAVMVGIGTALADNPRLTVRLVPGRSPTRVVVDSTLQLPLDAHVLTDGAAPTIIATTERADAKRREAVRAAGADLLIVGQDAGRVDLHHLLQRLGEIGIQSLLVEGGRGIITSLLSRQLVDRLTVCIAPKIIGEGIDAIGDLNILTMNEAITFTRTSFRTVGEDLIFEGQIEWSSNRPVVPPSP